MSNPSLRLSFIVRKGPSRRTVSLGTLRVIEEDPPKMTDRPHFDPHPDAENQQAGPLRYFAEIVKTGGPNASMIGVVPSPGRSLAAIRP